MSLRGTYISCGVYRFECLTGTDKKLTVKEVLAKLRDEHEPCAFIYAVVPNKKTLLAKLPSVGYKVWAVKGKQAFIVRAV